MKGEESLVITVECLRGRLLAERAVSKAANDNARLMDAKLKELEEQIKTEVKLRKKAEKKLNSLKKKLEMLNISFSVVSEGDGESSSSIPSGDSCISSIASNSSFTRQEDSLFNSDISNSNSVTDKCGCEEINLDRLKTLTLEKNKEDAHCEKEDGIIIDKVDDSMALILVDRIVESEDSCNTGLKEVSDDNVREVLNNLKQIKECIRSTLERRHVISVV